MKLTKLSAVVGLFMLTWNPVFPSLAQEEIRRITIPENTELIGKLDKAMVRAKVGESRQIKSLKFLVKKQGKMRAPKGELAFGEPFYVELVFVKAGEPEALDVTVSLGDGRTLEVRVFQQSAGPTRYLSNAQTLERLEDQP